MSTHLEHKLLSVMEAFPAKCALYAVDLTSGASIAAIGAHTRVVSASTIKVPLMFCALQKAMDGELSLTDFIPIPPEDFRADTEVFESGYRTGGCTLWEHLYWMIVSSDNTATNTIISLLGYEEINRYFAELGLKDTSLQRKMLDFTAVEEGRNNYTSPMDQYLCYSVLYHGKILNEPLREVARDLLTRSRSFDGLLRYIPDNIPVLRKGGALDHLNHGAGIVMLPNRPYFIGIFTWDGPALDGEPQQLRLIGQLSRMVYDTMKQGEPL